MTHTRRTLQKRAGQPTNIEKEKNFVTSLQNLFDIAHGDALQTLDEKSKDFLINQRKEGRPGHIGDVESRFDVEE